MKNQMNKISIEEGKLNIEKEGYNHRTYLRDSVMTLSGYFLGILFVYLQGYLFAINVMFVSAFIYSLIILYLKSIEDKK